MTAPVVVDQREPDEPNSNAVDRIQATWSQAAMSASSVALVVLLPVVMVSWVLATDVSSITGETVADRWSNPVWRAVDWVFLVVAFTHGTLGTVDVLRAGVRSPAARAVWTGLVLVLAVAMVLLGSHTLFTFEVR